MIEVGAKMTARGQVNTSESIVCAARRNTDDVQLMEWLDAVVLSYCTAERHD
jgi:hypothetical protein